MPGFSVDHVVIQTPEREAVAAAIAQAAGLPLLTGYSIAGVVQSSGVRFANGPFLDIFHTPQAGTALILAGAVDEAEALARTHAWGVRLLRRDDAPADTPVFPWSMALFKRNQGLLTRISIIDYETDPAAWADADFQGALYRPARHSGARLNRVWLGAQEVAKAGRDLAALGYAPSETVTSTFWPYAGRRMTGPAADLVVFEAGEETVARLDIETGAGTAQEVVLTGAPRVVLDELG
jgi:hypothetical protein